MNLGGDRVRFRAIKPGDLDLERRGRLQMPE